MAKKKIIPHKKGDFAGMVVMPLCGYCKSYFSEDGYHEEGSYKIVDAPKEASDELA